MVHYARKGLAFLCLLSLYELSCSFLLCSRDIFLPNDRSSFRTEDRARARLSLPSARNSGRTFRLAVNDRGSDEISQKKATLDAASTWRIRMVLNNVSTKEGKRVDEILNLDCNFVEEVGYEPPQGFLQQLVAEDTRCRISKSRWILSEDPEDRKDGLWIWGLFKEPLYPYLLLTIQTDEIPLAGNDTILPLKLYSQVTHKRDETVGVVLDGVFDLNVRQTETLQADPFGAAKVDVYENVKIGRISIQAM